jgi:hypothetical protein
LREGKMGMAAQLQPGRERGSGLADVVELILDKGLIINADITVSVAGVELLGQGKNLGYRDGVG